MAKRLVFSERNTKSAAALAGLTLNEVNERAGLGSGYISRKWGNDRIHLMTINRVADVLGCDPETLMEVKGAE